MDLSNAALRAESRASTVCVNCMEKSRDLAASPSASARPLRRCSHCKGPKYCSTACQAEHWPSHRLLCALNASRRAAFETAAAAAGTALPEDKKLRKWAKDMQGQLITMYVAQICEEAVRQCRPVSAADLNDPASRFCVLTATLALDSVLTVDVAFVSGAAVPFQVHGFQIKTFGGWLCGLSHENQERYRKVSRVGSKPHEDEILFYVSVTVNNKVNLVVPTQMTKDSLSSGDQLVTADIVRRINAGFSRG